MFKLEKHFLWLSLIGHIISLALIGLYFDFSTQIINLGEVNSPIIHSYLSSNIVLKTQATSAKTQAPTTQVKKSEVTQTKSLLAIRRLTSREQKQSIAQSLPSTSGNGKPIPELVALLHEAIQQQQHYPENALTMQREGRVTVMFKLLKNGSIMQLRIIQSSGTASLDEAALAAVTNATPFKQVVKFLKNDTQEYKIDIVFTLT